MIIRKVRIRKIIKDILIILSLVFIFLAIYIKKSFGDISFEQFLYTITTAEGTSFSVVNDGILFVGIRVLIIFIIIKLINKIDREFGYSSTLVIRFFSRKIIIQSIVKKILLIIFIIFSCMFVIIYLGIFEYLEQQGDSSTIFESYYVDARNVEIQFPKVKKNLIYILVESLEATVLSEENGGIEKRTYIPNLEQVALENINFSNTNKLGGFYTQSGNSWTASALVSHTSGIPLKIPINGNSYLGYGEFLPGAYSIGEVLESNGYKNYFLLGSDADFGGRREYFVSHGNYKIMDYNWAIKNKYIEEDYYVWWGYEDLKLYEIAKKELLKIASNKEPFNFTMLTADTHFFDGYVGENCPDKFEEQYANAYYCTDLMLNDFIKWIKQQDFYDDTVIIIVGDHLTMQHEFFEGLENYDRVVYNAFINTDFKKINNKKRIISTMDLYPTTIAALGAKINGDRLGLGTNLFSNKRTLIEELGSINFNGELDKNSSFYNNKLLKNSYYEMKKEER